MLSFDKKFYTFKKKLFDYNEYTEITNKLFLKKDHQFKGVISALTVRDLSFLNYIDRLRLPFYWKLSGHNPSFRYQVTKGNEAPHGFHTW